MKKTWKNTERKVAEMMNGKRNPVALQCGENKQPDVSHAVFNIEVKHRKTLPKLLSDAMTQAINSKDKSKVPLVVLHEKGKRHNNDFVVMRMIDFKEIHGELLNDENRTL